MFEEIRLLQRCHLFFILIVLVGHILLIVLRRYKRNKEINNDLGSYVIRGYKKSIYGEILKRLDMIVFIIFPYTFHFFYVSMMFLGSYVSTIEKELNWEIGVRIYAKSLLTIVFCVLFHRCSLKIYGSFDVIFLFPTSLSECTFVSLQKRGVLNRKITRVIKEFFSGSSHNASIICKVNNGPKHVDFFGLQFSRYFEYKGERYWWTDGKFVWSREYLMKKLTCRLNMKLNEGHLTIEPLNEEERRSILEFVGSNTLEFPEISTFNLIIRELKQPINIIRLMALLDSIFYSFIVWPLCWSTLTFYSIFWSIIRRRRSHIETQKTSRYHDNVLYKSFDEQFNPLYLNTSKTNLKSSLTRSKELCPGVIIFIDKSMRVPADLVLLTGSIVVDGSCLTGEAIPQSKTANGSLFSLSELTQVNHNFNGQSKVFEGSQVIEVSSSTPALAIVVRTASVTLNNIFCTNSLNIHPFINLDSPFEGQTSPNDSFKGSSRTGSWNIKTEPLWVVCFFFGLFIAFLDAYLLSFEIGSIFFIFSTVIYMLPFWTTTSMSFSYNSSIKRLIEKDIVSANPCKFGKLKLVDTVCFDKTGTLTMPGFNIYKVHIYPKTNPKDGVESFSFTNSNNAFSSDLFHLLNDEKAVFNAAMATCNNLVFQDFENGLSAFKPSGSKLELCLFSNSGYFGCKVFACNSERVFVVPDHNKDKFVCELKDLYGLSNKISSFRSIEHISAAYGAIEIVKRYPFDEDLRLQSVFVRRYFIYSETKDSHNFSVRSASFIFVKGAVENITELIDGFHEKENRTRRGNNSDLECEVNFFDKRQCSAKSKSGFKAWSNNIVANQISGSYVLGFCYIPLNDDTLVTSTSKIKEEELLHKGKQKSFINSYRFIPLGIVELFSPIRKESREIMQTLLRGNFHCPIITGDNMNSAVLISKELGTINDNLVSCSVDDNQNLVWEFVSQGKKEIIDRNVVLNLTSHSILDLIPDSVLDENSRIAINICAFRVFIEFLNASLCDTDRKDTRDKAKNDVLDKNRKVFSKLLENTVIFSRFTPEYKGKVVSLFESIGRTVFFVGDGHNDVVALQKANVGLMLSNVNDADEDNNQKTDIGIKDYDLYSKNTHNLALAPFIAKVDSENGLESVIKLILETRGVVFILVSKYIHIINLGTFFVSCKSILLWNSHAIIPAMSWLFIDVFCTLFPLLLFSLSTPNESKVAESKEGNATNSEDSRHSLLNNEGNLNNFKINVMEEADCYSRVLGKKISSYEKNLFSSLYGKLYTIPVWYGNHLIYTSTFVSLAISVSGYITVLYRLTNYMLPKNGMSSSYDHNRLFPTHLWYVKQDNFESASSWCYIAFQLVNQFWSIWTRCLSIIDMRMSVYFLIWNLSMNSFILFLIWTKPCILSCIFRINCDDEVSLKGFTTLFNTSSPFYGQYKHNVFPFEWKLELTFWCFLFFSLNMLYTVIVKRIAISKRLLGS